MAMREHETKTPAEVDTLLAPLEYEIAKQEARAASYRQAAARYGADTANGAYYEGQAQEADALREAAAVKAAPLHGEFAARGGWTRAFLVTNHGGHVHNSMACTTCFATTAFEFLPQVSGMDEAQIVDLAGERACTVCYPSAPVDVLARATRLFSKSEAEAQAAREQRDAKRAEKAAATVTGEDGRVLYKTVRGATNAVAQALSDLCWYGESHPSANEWKTEVETVRAALARKGVEYDYDAVLTRVRKRVKAEAAKIAANPGPFTGADFTADAFPKY